MTIKALTEKLEAVVEYLRQQEKHHADEAANMQDDIDALLSRVAALESLVDELE